MTEENQSSTDSNTEMPAELTASCKSKKSCCMGLFALFSLLGLVTGSSALFLQLKQHKMAESRLQDSQAELQQTISQNLHAELSGEVKTLDAKLASNQETITNLESQLKTLNTALTDMQQKLQLATTDNHNTDHKWLLPILAARVHSINLSLQLHPNQQAVVSQLQSVMSELSKIHDPQLEPIKQSLTTELDAIKTSKNSEISDIMVELSASQQLVESLIPKKTLPLVSNSAQEVANKSTPRWRENVNNAWLQIQKIIIIRHNQKAIEPLLGTEQLSILQHNLLFMLRQAQWAALVNQPNLYQQSLNDSKQWIETYFDVNDAKAVQLLAHLKNLVAISLSTSLPNLDHSEQLFSQVMQSSNDTEG